MGKKRKEPELKESYIKKMLKIEKEHFKKYGHRHMSLKELRGLFEGK
ncbi:MAG: hypothetical protein V1493_00620 [Candidatus Diapherotrites archaeon]